MAPARKKPKAHQKCKIVKSGTKFIDNYRREFIVGKEIGQGGFGRIYEATQAGVPKSVFAVKMEPMGNGPLFTEMHVYMKVLKEEFLAKWKKEKGLKFLGLPSLISSGKFTYEEQEEMRYIVLPRYNDSVEQAIERNEGKLAYKDVVDIAKSVLDAFSYLHSQEYVHADVKASNLLMEKTSDFKHVVLIDFGLARKLSEKLVEKEDKKQCHNGTAIFTSCDAHRGCTPSYRGDLEILTHNMLLWLSGFLPWKQFEDSPAKVFELKKSFVENAAIEVPKLLKSKKEASLIIKFYKFAGEMEYGELIDFPKLLESL